MSPLRKQLAAYGRKGKPGWVRVVTETVDQTDYVRVLWQEGGRRRTESWLNTRKGQAEAKAYAEGLSERLSAATTPAPARPRRSLREVWEAYALAEQDALKLATVTTTRNRWRKFELFAGEHTMADEITRETLDRFKRELFRLEHAPNQVANHLATVRLIFRWAEEHDVVPPTKVATYRIRIGKAVRATGPKMEEFTAAQSEQVLAQLSPRDARQWRAWALTTLLRWCGPRQNAARQLEWSDIDLARGAIRWRAETDKTSAERWQPMPAEVLSAFWVAYGWRIAEEYAGPYVFSGAQRRTRGQAVERPAWAEDPKHKRRGKTTRAVVDQPYTYAAYNAALHAAEKRAGLEPVKYKAAHAFRRGIAGDVFEKTGSEKAAAEWIGDKSVRVVRDRYLLTREERLRDTAAQLGNTSAAPKASRSAEVETPRNATTAHDGAVEES